jgi:hypothetical protein
VIFVAGGKVAYAMRNKQGKDKEQRVRVEGSKGEEILQGGESGTLIRIGFYYNSFLFLVVSPFLPVKSE